MTANVFLLHIGYLITVYALPGNLRASLAMLGLAYLIYGLNVGQYILSHLRYRKHSERQAGSGEVIAA